ALILRCAVPSLTVASVLGAGECAMSMAEPETAVRLRIGVPVVVLADDALSQIKAGQERKGLAVTGTTFGSVDYAKLAAAFGIERIVASDQSICRAALRNTPRDPPLLVAGRTDPRAYQLGSRNDSWQCGQLAGCVQMRCSP